MDTVLVQKVLTYLAYPAGFTGLLIVLALFGRLLYLENFSKKCFWLALIIFFLSSNSWVASYLANNLEKQYPQFSISNTPKADVIVVLGGSIAPPTNPRKFSQFTNQSNRYWLAGELYKAGKAKQILLSGGNVFDLPNQEPESNYIRRQLVLQGIPETAIIVEPNSRTTRENALNTNQLLTEINAKSALLVTSAIHMPRAIQLFTPFETNFIPVPSDIIVTDNSTPVWLRMIPSSQSMNLTTQALHEYYAIIVEKISRAIHNF